MSDTFESETSRFRAERTRSQSYFYPHSTVLVNKLDIREQSLLDKAEDRAVRMNSAGGKLLLNQFRFMFQ